MTDCIDVTANDAIAPQYVTRQRSSPLAAPQPRSPWSQGIIAVADLLATWIMRLRDRRALAGLDQHMLQDLGLSPGDVHQEADKPFWKA